MSAAPLHIALVTRNRVPAALYGGTQRVVWSLARALQRAGHRVTMLAAPGSHSADGVEVVAADPQRSLESQVPAGCDVVHLHEIYPDGPLFGGRPCIVTIHGNRVPPTRCRNCVCLTADHALRLGQDAWVPNGLDWSLYPQAPLGHGRSGLHFLGKGAWRVKNLRGAISIARRAGERLEVLGATRLNLKMGFRLTLTRRARFHGMVGDATKALVSSRSRALLLPVTWDEPFGLALIESLYYGAGVIGTPWGSFPEIVTPDTGVLSSDTATLVEAARTARFDPEACHQRALDFSADAMAQGYLALYRRVAEGLPLNAAPPAALPALATHRLQ